MDTGVGSVAMRKPSGRYYARSVTFLSSSLFFLPYSFVVYEIIAKFVQNFHH